MHGLKGSRPSLAAKAMVDTHTLVWALAAPNKLSDKARNVIADSEVVASVATLWELLLKRGKPGALLADPVPWWDKYVVRAGIPVIGIRQSHVMALDQLIEHHKDPFDRILVAQAIIEKAVLVTKDEHLAAYGIPVVW